MTDVLLRREHTTTAPSLPAAARDSNRLVRVGCDGQRWCLRIRADARLKAPDPQRVTRALAVLEATGRSLATFQGEAQEGLLGAFAIERMVVDPGRDTLSERIARRFGAMFDAGAVAEVEALRAMNLDPSLPAMKAIGVPEISAWLDGEMSREEAIERAVIATRQYAKRQRTWIRNRMGDWPRVT